MIRRIRDWRCARQFKKSLERLHQPPPLPSIAATLRAQTLFKSLEVLHHDFEDDISKLMGNEVEDPAELEHVYRYLNIICRYMETGALDPSTTNHAYQPIFGAISCNKPVMDHLRKYRNIYSSLCKAVGA